jgi:hypothetical protein
MMIEGLKVTMSGEELRELLDERAAECRESAAHWQRESERTSKDATVDAPLLPDHMCKNEAAHQEWRATVLDLLRERMDASEVYRLGLKDLKYVGFFPSEPEMFGPDESEDSTDDASDLGPHAQRVCMSPEIIMVTNPDGPER